MGVASSVPCRCIGDLYKGNRVRHDAGLDFFNGNIGNGAGRHEGRTMHLDLTVFVCCIV